MTFDEFVMMVNTNQHHRDNQREGQYCYNLLRGVSGYLAAKVCGTENDPFYFDDRIPQFFEFLKNNWETYSNECDICHEEFDRSMTEGYQTPNADWFCSVTCREKGGY